MKKFIFSITSFFVIIIAIMLIKKISIPYYYGDEVFYAKLNDIKNNYPDINTVFFGSSRIYRHINTPLLDSLSSRKIISYNLSVGGTYFPESFFLYENFLASKNDNQIKYAFVELQKFMLPERSERTVKGTYWLSFNYLMITLKHISSSNLTKKEKGELYQNTFKRLLYNLYNYKIIINFFKFSSSGLKGYKGFFSLDDEFKLGKLTERREYYLSNLKLNKIRNEAAQLNYNNFKLNEYFRNYLNNLIIKSEEKGVKLVYILSPRLLSDYYEELIPIRNSIDKSNIIDMSNKEKFNEFYDEKFLFDHGHLNFEGAEIYTKYLYDEIKLKFDFE